MRINLNFYIDISENSNVDELKKIIIDAFKDDFQIIFQGKKIKPGQELSKINISKDSKLFLLFSKLKATNVDISIFTPIESEKAIDFDKRTNSTNVEFKKISKEKDRELKSVDNIEAGHKEKKSSFDAASKTQISEINETGIDEGNARQLNDENCKLTPSEIKQAVEDLVNRMLSNSNRKKIVTQIAKNPQFFDLFAKVMIEECPNLNLFLFTYKSEIIQSCKEKCDKSISNPEIEEIEQVPDRKTNEFYCNAIAKISISGEHEKALDWCNEALMVYPQDAVLRSLKVWTLVDLKRFDEAFGAYNYAIEIFDFPTNTYLWRGKVLYAMNKKTEVLAELNEGIASYPSEYEQIILKGKILYDLNEREESISCFVSAFRINGLIAVSNFKDTFPDAKEIFEDRFPGFSIKKGFECNICRSKFDINDTQYLCLYCKPNHYQCDNCEKNINANAEGSDKYSHPHSTFIIHPNARKLNKVKFGASTEKNIQYLSDQKDKKFYCICGNSSAGYCEANASINGIRYKCAHCIDFDLCEGCQNKFVDGEINTMNCLKSSGHKLWHIMIKMKIP